MIYIISPFLTDVKKVCEENFIPCQVKNGKILNEYIVWVHDLTQLFNVKIMKKDKIYFGSGCHYFPDDQYERLVEEINLRKQQ